MNSPRKGEEPLSLTEIQALKDYQKQHGLTKEGMATKIGIKRSTFSDILNGGNVSRKNKEKIRAFMKQNTSSPPPRETHIRKATVEELTQDLMQLRKDFSATSQELLLLMFRTGSELVIRALRELLNNSDAATRDKLRAASDDAITDLFVGARAISSEDALRIIKNEVVLRKTKTTIFPKES